MFVAFNFLLRSGILHYYYNNNKERQISVQRVFKNNNAFSRESKPNICAFVEENSRFRAFPRSTCPRTEKDRACSHHNIIRVPTYIISFNAHRIASNLSCRLYIVYIVYNIISCVQSEHNINVYFQECCCVHT